ncbi:hypothetical protein ASL20_04925 [Cupriavidus necator]|uniref:hypothetical protein n=2 Tax=Cupriavidus TaxID=106589 RepID=UPI00032EF4BB|nr:hypothetical protein [Cupriavidus sp. GA3-3]EON16289.1 hypothetical protein C265_28526 [Cupriavidus sp. GA3-3]KUE90095.1 hypothetical protein ASL20_04925 [Cupriavidus necator]
MTGNAMTQVEWKRMALDRGRRGDHPPGPTRMELSGTLQMQDIVQALGAEPDEQRCVEAGLEVLAMAGHPPARAVVSMDHGRPPALEFYVDAAVPTCCELDCTVQHAIASRFTSVLPPGLAVTVLPLAAYAQEATDEVKAFDADTLRTCARELLGRGGEMNQRLAVVCAYLSALHGAQAVAEQLGYLEQSLLARGQEALSWRLRRHRSVEGRELAQALEGLSRAAAGALYEFGASYSAARASYQLEQMQRVHDRIARFRDTCRHGGRCPEPRHAVCADTAY